MITGEERQGSLVAKRPENIAIDPARIAHLTIALGDHAVALLLQLPAAAQRLQRLSGAVQQNDCRRAVGPDIKIKCGSAHADRSSGVTI